jgi:hypothetical protein
MPPEVARFIVLGCTRLMDDQLFGGAVITDESPPAGDNA